MSADHRQTRILHFVSKGTIAEADVKFANVWLLQALMDEPNFRFQWESVQAKPKTYQLTIWTKAPDDREWLERLGISLERQT